MLFLEGSLFKRIKSHKKMEGSVIFFTVQLIRAKNGHKYEVNVLFDDLKREEPMECAKYIHKWVEEGKQGRGYRPLNQWARSIINRNEDCGNGSRKVNPYKKVYCINGNRSCTVSNKVNRNKKRENGRMD